jgi:hypothetical protein
LHTFDSTSDILSALLHLLALDLSGQSNDAIGRIHCYVEQCACLDTRVTPLGWT